MKFLVMIAASIVINIQRAALKNRLFFAGILVSFIVSFTPFYSVGYITFLLVIASRIWVIKYFDTYLSNVVVASMVFAASIMTAGIFTSIIHIPNIAAINILFACIFFYAIIFFQNKTTQPRKKMIELSDVLCILAAFAVPLTLIIVNISSAPLEQVLFKLVNADGWDNTSHLNLLQVVSENKNYFYSSSPMTVEGSSYYNNYPQGWHLATSSIVNGIVPDAFNTQSHGLNGVFIAYLVSVFSWFIITVYIFAKIVWGVVFGNRKIKAVSGESVSFLITLAIPLFGILLASLKMGYANYIAIMPFILLVVIASYQLIEAKTKGNFLLYISFTTPLVVGASLIWVLPAPALIGLIMITASVLGIKPRDLIKYKTLWVIVSIATASMIIYLFILMQDVGLSHLYATNVWLRAFPSTLLVLICLLLILGNPARKATTISSILAVVSPFVVYIFIVWLLTYFLDSKLGYYQTKLFGIVFVVIAVFACMSIMRITETAITNLGKSRFILPVTLTLCLVGTLFVVSNQKVDLGLFRRSRNYLTYEERVYISKWMITSESTKEDGQLFLMRDNIVNDRNFAMLYNRITPDAARRFLAASSPGSSTSVDKKYVCLMNVYYESNPYIPKDIIFETKEDSILYSLSECLKIRSESNLPTTIRLPRTLKSKTENIQTYNARLIYYDNL